LELARKIVNAPKSEIPAKKKKESKEGQSKEKAVTLQRFTAFSIDFIEKN
jgi:hypothetical protein